MSMLPSTRLKKGIARALQRRYGYAALRTLRLAAGAAVEDHLTRSRGEGVYDGVTEVAEIYRLYWQGLQRLRRQFPTIDLEDVRAEP